VLKETSVFKIRHFINMQNVARNLLTNITHKTTFLKIFSSYELRDLFITQRKK
jgi:hypothetical protein